MMLWNDVLTMLGWMLYRLPLRYATVALCCNIGWVAVGFYSRMSSSGGAGCQDTGFCPLRIIGCAPEHERSKKPSVYAGLRQFEKSFDNNLITVK